MGQTVSERIQENGATHIVLFKTSICFSRRFNVLKHARLCHQFCGNLANAFSDSGRRFFINEHSFNKNKFIWGRFGAVVRDECDARVSRSKSSSACVGLIISDTDLFCENGVGNFRVFCRGGESKDSAAQADFF